mmetsp:Transcript_3668/g.8828  ORF Transcript_3668/g.8828 Transcript_3668/m.8828 type:complete len:95 (-) Transcript_3668:276-560(-)
MPEPAVKLRAATLVAEPTRVNWRSDSELPACAKFSIEALDPIRAKDRREHVDPTCAYQMMDSLLKEPTASTPFTDKELPPRQKLRMDSAEPMEA